MYLGMIALTTIILPLTSIGIESTFAPETSLVFLIGKWFVFWAVGVRLMLAGLRQIVDPAFTAETIFKIKDPGARKVVVELGFGNVAIALLALLSVYWTDWIMPAAVVGAFFAGSRACSICITASGPAWRKSPWCPICSSRPSRSSIWSPHDAMGEFHPTLKRAALRQVMEAGAMNAKDAGPTLRVGCSRR